MMIKTGLIVLGTVLWLSGEPLSFGKNAERDMPVPEPEHPPHKLAEVALAYLLDKGDRAYWAW